MDTYFGDGNRNNDSDPNNEEFISWINWFCELKGNEFFCVVDREFIADEFNLTGLSSMVSFYHYALELILDVDAHCGSENGSGGSSTPPLTEEQQRLVESSAETLYGLIHARFITTNRGLKMMEDKFANCDFGTCPRVFCGGQAVLPVGQSDVVRESSVKLFCPKCEDIYYPRSSRHKSLDGAFWGTTFPHLLLLQMRDNPSKTIPKPVQRYVPRIYGFRVRQPGTFVENEENGMSDIKSEDRLSKATNKENLETKASKGTNQEDVKVGNSKTSGG
ncbi:casein kinase II subunit beta [Angomonas deanei]|nr:casein kinase II subunit beta [Angomonas deanei]|eukprot:EPY39954.1 casein kinase II subunit beta [Angomonas deanei]